MDKLVKRVTIVHGGAGSREAKVVYEEKDDSILPFPMDDVVRSVTVVQGSGAARQSEVIYWNKRWPQDDSSWETFERGVRRALKADMVRAQEAYERHTESVQDGKSMWWLDAPANIAKSLIKADKESRKAAPSKREK